MDCKNIVFICGNIHVLFLFCLTIQCSYDSQTYTLYFDEVIYNETLKQEQIFPQTATIIFVFVI